MTADTEFDLGPLTWVKGEIDLALEKATEAIHLFAANGDATQLKFCRTHLHQVHGALAVVGLDGLTRISEAIENLLIALENRSIEPPGPALEAIQEAFAALRQYLDDLVAGEANQPLRLLPIYQALMRAAGKPAANPADLFFPDLGRRPPKRAPTTPMTQAERNRLIRAERGRFQKGLLAWLRQPEGSEESRAGLAQMQEALRRIEATQISPAARTFWWAALGLVTALMHGAGRAGDARSLCARIDLQIRRLLEGQPGVAERLLRDALYFVAHSPADADPLLAEIQSTYRLPELIPAPAQMKRPGSAPQEAKLRRLKETVLTAEEQWNRFCAGSASALTAFVEQTRSGAQLAAELDHAHLKRLAQALTAAANWLAQQPSRQSDGVAMEIATALLLIQTALENYGRLGADFAQQADLMVERLNACMAGQPLSDTHVPLLDEMSRRAQERLLMAQVAREIQSNLAQVEQVLDVYFRDPGKPPEAASLEAPLGQIAGALTILGQDAAVDYLRACERDILAFTRPDYVANPADFEAVAQRLSELGFFVDALQHGPVDFPDFIARLQRAPAAETESAQEGADRAEAAASGPEEVEEAPQPSVESQLERLKQETRKLLENVQNTPDAPGLREDLQAHLEALQKDADLVADQSLLAQAKAALAALAEAPPELPHMQAVAKALAPIGAQVEAPAPTAQTLQLAQASTDELDAELLAIFLEEAQEVLGTIAEQLGTLRVHPHDHEALTVIRRSVHTLKGSGRMVGLKDLGEAAWCVEQTLNLWLRQELEVTPALIELIDETHRVFACWVEHLSSGDGLVPDAAPLVALAERLRQGDVTPPVAASATAPAQEKAAPATSEALPAAPPAAAPPEAADADAESVPDELLASRFELGDFDLEGDTPPAALASEAAPIEIELGELLPEFAGEAQDVSGEATEAKAAAVPAETPSPVASPEATPPAGAPESRQTITISPQLYEIFRDEARGHLDKLHAFLAELSQAPGMPTPFEIGRAAHTLAGIAGTVGILPINKLGQALEHALLRRDAALHPDSLEGMEVLRQTLDMLEDMLARLAEGQMPEAQPSLIDALTQIYPATENGAPVAKDLATVLGERLAPEGQADDVPAAGAAPDQSDRAEAPDQENAAAGAPPDADVAPAAGGTGAAQAGSVPEAPSSASASEAGTAPSTPAPEAGTPPAASALLRDEIDTQLLPIFLEEAGELLDDIQANISAWRADKAGAAAPQALARLLHTFKGSARMAGAMNLGQLTHAVESRVGELGRSGTVQDEDLDEIAAACDVLSQIVERYQAGDYSLDGLLGGVPAAPENAAGTPPAAGTQDAPATSVTSANLPVAAADAPLPARPSPVETHEVHEVHEGEAGQRLMLRVRAELIDQLVNEAGEMAIARARIEGEMRELKDSLRDLTENVIRLRRQLREIEIQAETQIQAGAGEAAKAEFDPLELDRFTRFQELTRMMAESVNDVATVQQNLLKNLDDANAALVAQARLNRSLQQSLMSVRMMPFASQSERLYRLVRQAAKETGKRANLEIHGGQVELDRSVLEKVMSPLEHMLRNAVVHGLETRAARLAAGKPEIGEIDLALTQEGNEIILTLSDDGAGLDLGRIRAKAEALGLIAPGEAVDDARLVDFIFHSGFSTASEVSQLAGRGVGMDVVKTEIGALGGRIEVLTQPGHGTTFRLYLPLTLAVTQAVLVQAGEHSYAIPSTLVEQVMEVRDKALDDIRNKGEVVWQDHHYPFHYLPRLLGDNHAQPQSRRLQWILLLRSGSQRVAVLVDDMHGKSEIVVKNVGPQLARVVGIAGATVLGDGRIVLILNPVALASRQPGLQGRVETGAAPSAGETGRPAEAAPVTHQPTVLVVDDSLTVRKITSKLLAREGYQVELAKDGVEALERLVDKIPDVILSDIEMPRMDGFDLVRNIRADERLAKVPIIMITSRTAEKHRNYAMEIGANHYLGKPYDEAELLGLLARYTGRA